MCVCGTIQSIDDDEQVCVCVCAGGIGVHRCMWCETFKQNECPFLVKKKFEAASSL